MTTFKLSKKAKLIIDIVSYVAIAIIVFLSILSLSLSITTKRETELPRLFGGTVMMVETNSMEPTIKRGDLVKVRLLDEAGKKELKVDDIITFKFDNPQVEGVSYNTHRIVEVLTDNNGNVFGFRTKGDNNNAIDKDTVYLTDIAGVYNGRLGGLGSFMNFLRSTAGFIVLIILPLVIFAGYRIYVLVKIILDIKKKKDGDNAPTDTVELLKELEELKAKLAETKVEVEMLEAEVAEVAETTKEAEAVEAVEVEIIEPEVAEVEEVEATETEEDKNEDA